MKIRLPVSAFSATITTVLLSLVLVIFPAGAAEEPDFDVEFSFGSMGVNAQIADAETGEKIPREMVEFWALPSTADSIDEVEKIKVEAPGYEPAYVSGFTRMSLNMGFLQIVVLQLGEVNLTPSRAKKPVLNVYSEPTGGKVYIDAEAKGTTPMVGLRINSGSHVVEVVKEGYENWSRRIYLEDGDEKTITASEASLEEENSAPIADYNFTPSKPSTGERVRFSSNSQDKDGSITNYVWKFEGGGKEWGKTVTKQFEHPGQYRVTLAVTDDDGLTEEVTDRIRVQKSNTPPEADFKYTPSRIKTGEEVRFKDDSVDKSGYISDRTWSFGDGTNSTKENPKHTYESPGTYSVKLVVVDQKGATDTKRKEVKVRSWKPSATFTFSPKNPVTGEEITLNASQSTDKEGGLASYHWNIGGDAGERLKGEKITHTFSSAGEKRVELTVTDMDGKKDSFAQNITVRESTNPIGEKYALVIGIANYKNAPDYQECNSRFCDLRYTDKDAKEFYQLLKEDLSGFKDENLSLLLNDEATASAIRGEFGHYIKTLDKDDLLVFYYSGHGGRETDIGNDESDGMDEYYLPYGVKQDDLFATAIRDDEFGNWMSSLKTNNVVIILDSCFSGGATKSIKGLSPGGLKAAPYNNVFSDFELEDKVLLAASEENQPSLESEKLNQGVFTHYLLKALKGKADLDQDGNITVNEVYKYVKPKVKEFAAETGEMQTPLLKGTQSSINMVTAKKRGSSKKIGKLTAISGEKEVARKGDRVLINRGKDSGVSVGDLFSVYRVYKLNEAQSVREKRAEVKVINLLGSNRSLARVAKSIVPVEVGNKVRYKAKPQKDK